MSLLKAIDNINNFRDLNFYEARTKLRILSYLMEENFLLLHKQP